METGNDYHTNCVLRLLNQGGTVYEDYESKDLETAFQRAESYLKNDFPNEFYEIEIE